MCEYDFNMDIAGLGTELEKTLRGLNKWSITYTSTIVFDGPKRERKKVPGSLSMSPVLAELQDLEIPARRFGWATDQGANQSRKTGIFPFHIAYQTQNTFGAGAQSAGDPSWLWSGEKDSRSIVGPDKNQFDALCFPPASGAFQRSCIRHGASHLKPCTQTGRPVRSLRFYIRLYRLTVLRGQFGDSFPFFRSTPNGQVDFETAARLTFVMQRAATVAGQARTSHIQLPAGKCIHL